MRMMRQTVCSRKEGMGMGNGISREIMGMGERISFGIRYFYPLICKT